MRARTSDPSDRPVHRAGAGGAIALHVASMLLLAACASAPEPPPATDEREVVDLSPETPPTWSFRYLTAPVISLFRGPSYMYAPQQIEIETTPAGGYVDLFYVRSGFQKRFEQAEAPVTVILPSRLRAGPRDAFTVRAFAEGYRQKSVTVKLGDRLSDLTIDLDPLPNQLDGVSHRYFAGRTAITFLTRVALTFRVQETDDGYAVILTETALTPESRAALETIESPLLREGYGQQLGEDLMVKLVLADPAAAEQLEVRSQQRYDGPRDLYEFALELVPTGSEAERIEAALAAIEALGPGDVTGCALAFDDALRSELDAGSLARALRPRGAFTDRYLRAAMRRLGELSVDGVVGFVDGTQLRPASPLELEMAIANSATAEGYLALLRRFVEHLEAEPAHRASALKSLIAPELPRALFEELLERADESERRCRGARDRAFAPDVRRTAA